MPVKASQAISGIGNNKIDEWNQIEEWNSDLLAPRTAVTRIREKDPRSIANDAEISDVIGVKGIHTMSKDSSPFQLKILITNFELSSNKGKKVGLHRITSKALKESDVIANLANEVTERTRVSHWKMLRYLYGYSLPDVVTEYRYAVRENKNSDIPSALITAGFNTLLLVIHAILQTLQLISQTISWAITRLPFSQFVRYASTQAANNNNSVLARIGFGLLSGFVGLLTFPWQFTYLTKLAYRQSTNNDDDNRNSRLARFGYGLLSGFLSIFTAPLQVFNVLANTIGYTRHIIDSSVTFVKAFFIFLVNIPSKLFSGNWWNATIEKPANIAWYSIKDFVNNGIKLLPVLAVSALAFFTLGGSLFATPAIAAVAAAAPTFLATAGATMVAAAVLAPTLITAGLISVGAALTQLLSVGLIGIKKRCLNFMDWVSPIKIESRPQKSWQISDNSNFSAADIEMGPIKSSDSKMSPMMRSRVNVMQENKQKVSAEEKIPHSPNPTAVKPTITRVATIIPEVPPKDKVEDDEGEGQVKEARSSSLGGG